MIQRRKISDETPTDLRRFTPAQVKSLYQRLGEFSLTVGFYRYTANNDVDNKIITAAVRELGRICGASDATLF